MLMWIEICQIHGQDSSPGGGLQRFKKPPDYLWPEIWSSMSKAAQKKEKQERTIEKPKLDNSRRLRGIDFIDPENGEYRETNH